jgi:hypothetical protein
VTTHNKETVCRFCGAANDAAANPFGAERPGDGDFTMCLYCGEWSVFDGAAAGGTRKPTSAEYDEIAADPTARRMRAAWVLANKAVESARRARR